MNIPDRSTFENLYAGQAPWDIGKAQKAFIDLAERITGPGPKAWFVIVQRVA